jgi:hypothetical protein
MRVPAHWPMLRQQASERTRAAVDICLYLVLPQQASQGTAVSARAAACLRQTRAGSGLGAGGAMRHLGPTHFYMRACVPLGGSERADRVFFCSAPRSTRDHWAPTPASLPCWPPSPYGHGIWTRHIAGMYAMWAGSTSTRPFHLARPIGSPVHRFGTTYGPSKCIQCGACTHVVGYIEVVSQAFKLSSLH